MFDIADAHNDFLAFHAVDEDNRLYDHTDVNRLKSGGVKLQNFAVWVPPETENRLDMCFRQIAYYADFLEENKDDVCGCSDEKALHNGNKICAVLSIESGESIDCRNEYIPFVYDKGARMMSLTWNGENEYAGGCMADCGLKKKGIEALKTLNELNMAFDVSHINEKGFWQALEVYEHAPCATHSCVFDLCKSVRNLKKDQIRALIERGGFIGINFYTVFLRGPHADIGDILDHIAYVLDCGGEEAVGFGSDFCGIMYTPDGLGSSSDYQKLPEAMLQRNYGEELISKICYGNFARYILKFLKQQTRCVQ